MKLLLDADDDGDMEEKEEVGMVPWNPNGVLICCWYSIGGYLLLLAGVSGDPAE